MLDLTEYSLLDLLTIFYRTSLRGVEIDMEHPSITTLVYIGWLDNRFVIPLDFNLRLKEAWFAWSRAVKGLDDQRLGIIGAVEDYVWHFDVLPDAFRILSERGFEVGGDDQRALIAFLHEVALQTAIDGFKE